jgi:hypothetical protein
VTVPLPKMSSGQVKALGSVCRVPGMVPLAEQVNDTLQPGHQLDPVDPEEWCMPPFSRSMTYTRSWTRPDKPASSCRPPGERLVLHRQLVGAQEHEVGRRRYADDFVIMVSGDRHHAEELREEVVAVLAPLGLRLAPEKTAVVHIDEGFNFLGFPIRRQRKRGTQKWYVYTKPSKKAIQSIKDKVSAKTYRSTRHQDLDKLITSLNMSLVGWANHFRHGVSKDTFSAVDHHAWHRLMRWIRAKYAGKTGLSMKQMRRRFCDVGWRFAHNGVVFTGASSVTVTRYRYRGGNIPTPWTPKPPAAPSG